MIEQRAAAEVHSAQGVLIRVEVSGVRPEDFGKSAAMLAALGAEATDHAVRTNVEVPF